MRHVQTRLTSVAAAPPTPASLDRPRLAVLLNCNARSVDASCVARLRRIVGADHVYASRNLQEAEAMARHVVQRGYRIVACGGGDGTLADAINRISRNVRQGNAWHALAQRREARQGTRVAAAAKPYRLPKFAFLPLGTGNALKQVVHSKDLYAHLMALACGQRFAALRLPMVEDENGETFFFGGMGYDSLLLHDYNRLLAEPRPAWAQPIVRSFAGYLAALGRDTLPTVLRGKAPLQLRVTSVGPATYFDPNAHDAQVVIAAGSVLYEGPAGMLGVSTVPYFGYGMRVFPFADTLSRAMQLRVASLSAPRVLANLPAIWRGNYRNAGALLDFAVSEVAIELASPFPFEQCGDDRGLRRHLHLRVSARPIQLLDFARPLAAPSQGPGRARAAKPRANAAWWAAQLG